MSKTIAIIILSVLVVILAGTTVYLGVFKKTATTENENANIVLTNRISEDSNLNNNQNSSNKNSNTSVLSGNINLNLNSQVNLNTNAEVLTTWNLVSGNASDTCTHPTFTGQAKVAGWYVWDYNYVEKSWMFKLSADTAPQLPVSQVYDESGYQRWLGDPVVSLAGANANLVEQLKQASADNPISLIVKGFRAYCEGAPEVSLSGSFN